MRRMFRLGLAAMAGLVLAALLAGQALAGDGPTLVSVDETNPTCAEDQGGQVGLGFEFDSPAAKFPTTDDIGDSWQVGDTFEVTGDMFSATVTVTAIKDPGEITGVSWVSNIPVDAVIMKASSGPHNVYVYDPDDLTAGAITPDGNPGGPTSGGPLATAASKGLSHIEFCYEKDENGGGNGELKVIVTKTADPSVKRGYEWSIKKWASHKRVLLARKKDPDAKKGYDNLSRFAKSAVVSYWVRVNATPLDHSHRVSGEITVSVPGDADSAAVITQVTDLVSPDIDAAPVTCDPALPETLEPGESLTCTYDAALPNGDARTNTATATAKLPDGQETEDFSSDAVPFDFSDPDVRGTANAEAVVYDSRVGFLGRVRASQTPRLFHYNLLVAPGGLAPLCGKGILRNTAVVKSPSGESSDSVTIPVEVRCFVSAPTDKKKSDPGKKNDTGSGSKDGKQVVNEKGKITGEPSAEAGAHPDNVCVAGIKVKRGTKGDPLWAGIGPKAHKTKFFNAPRSYSKVMRVKAKNPYYKLGRPYVRAKLNLLAGAPVRPAIGRSLVWADRWLANHKPAYTSKKKHVTKRTKRLLAKHTRALKHYNKTARGYQSPACTT